MNKSKELKFEAQKLRERIGIAISFLFKELQDENQTVELGKHEFQLEEQDEVVKDIYLEYSEEHDQHMMYATCIDNQDEEWYYLTSTIFNIDHSLQLLETLEAIKAERNKDGAILIPVVYHRLYDKQTGRYMATGYNAPTAKDLAEEYRSYKLGDATNEEEDIEIFTNATVDELFDMMKADEFEIETSEEPFEEQED